MITRRNLLMALAPPLTPEVTVFRAGEDGYHTYRIPALVATKKRTLLAFCEGRRSARGDSGNIDVLVKRSTDQGRTWSRASTVADFDGDTIGNPAPVADRQTGVIWLPLTRNPGEVTEKEILARTTRGTRTVWMTSSRDDGHTWSTPADITATTKLPDWTWYATGPGNGIQTRTGRLVIPCDHNRGPESERWSHVIYSDDHGSTWKLGGAAGPQCNECAVAELSDGSLLLNMRSYAGRNRRATSVSRDGGLTWAAPVLDDALLEPVCQASMIRYGKRGLLFANPASTKREKMTVRVSRNGGRTWTGERVVYAGPAAYSNLVELPRGGVGLLYEKGEKSPYETIAFATLPGVI